MHLVTTYSLWQQNRHILDIFLKPLGQEGILSLRTTVSLGQEPPSALNHLLYQTWYSCRVLYQHMEFSEQPMMELWSLFSRTQDYRRDKTGKEKKLTLNRRTTFPCSTFRNLPSCSTPICPPLKSHPPILLWWLGSMCCQLSNFAELEIQITLFPTPTAISIILPTKVPCCSLKIFHLWPLFS